MRSRAVLGQVVGLPDGHRAEAGAGPVRGAAVERRADDDDVGRGQGFGIVHVDGRDAQEGDVGTELGAVPRHALFLPGTVWAPTTYGFRDETPGGPSDSLAAAQPAHHDGRTHETRGIDIHARRRSSTTTPASSRPPRTTCGCTSPATRRYDSADVPIIVRGEGAYIYDVNGKRYLDALAGLFVSQLGHGRSGAGRGRGQADRAAGVHAAVVLRPPQRHRARRAGRRLRAGRPQPGLLHHRGRRGRRDRVEAGEELLQGDREALQAQGDQPRDRLPRHPAGRPVDHRPARA